MLNDNSQPFYSRSRERVVTTNYLINSPYKLTLKVRGYNPGRYACQLYNRPTGGRVKYITIEGMYQ
jgi:hypothetical protein